MSIDIRSPCSVQQGVSTIQVDVLRTCNGRRCGGAHLAQEATDEALDCVSGLLCGWNVIFWVYFLSILVHANHRHGPFDCSHLSQAQVGSQNHKQAPLEQLFSSPAAHVPGRWASESCLSFTVVVHVQAFSLVASWPVY